jgi:hypothetical protein
LHHLGKPHASALFRHNSLILLGSTIGWRMAEKRLSSGSTKKGHSSDPALLEPGQCGREAAR